MTALPNLLFFIKGARGQHSQGERNTGQGCCGAFLETEEWTQVVALSIDTLLLGTCPRISLDPFKVGFQRLKCICISMPKGIFPSHKLWLP